MSEEPLVYMPLERWGDLQNVFKVDWPRFISAYMVLENQRSLIQNGFDYGFKVYCPFGDVWNGMVAVNVKDQFYEIIIECHPDTEKLKNLEDALRTTKIVNWQREVIIPFAQKHVIECVRRAVGYHVKIDMVPVETFIVNEKLIFDVIKLPPGISFGPIPLEHLELVESTWPYRHATSLWYFRLLINAKYGYGLFEGKELVTWVFFNEVGELKHLYTVKNHRRKGYAELIVKLTCNILNKEGKPGYAFCVTNNVNSCKLFKKVGFTKSHPVAWFFLNKSE